jgi:BMFP domain-containing protein YqiC
MAKKDSYTKEIGDVMKVLEAIQKEIKETQVNLKKSIDQKCENIYKKLDDRFTKEFGDMKEHVDLEIGKLTRKVEQLETRIGAMEEKEWNNSSNPFDPEVTIVAVNLNEEQGERLEEKISDLFHEGLGIRDIEPRRFTRLVGRYGKPGIVKIELGCKDDKINILRAKSQLKHSDEFRRVYLRSSQTHAERLMSLNFREILKEIPNGNNYRVSGNGKILKKEDGNGFENTRPKPRTVASVRGRGRGRIHRE